MSGVWSSRPENGEWCGPERSDYPVPVFRPVGLGLDGRGTAGPCPTDKASRRLSAGSSRHGDRSRMAETPLCGSVHESPGPAKPEALVRRLIQQINLIFLEI